MRRRGFALAALLVAFALLPGCGGGEEDAAAGSDDALTLTLAEQAGPGQSGTATLTADGHDRTRVVVELSNPPGPSQPSHVHSGTCDDFGSIVGPLESVEGGNAWSVVPRSLKELRRGGPIVHAHKSEARLEGLGRVCRDPERALADGIEVLTDPEQSHAGGNRVVG